MPPGSVVGSTDTPGGSAAGTVGVAGAVAGVDGSVISVGVALVSFVRAPPLLLIVTPGAISTVDEVAPDTVDWSAGDAIVLVPALRPDAGPVPSTGAGVLTSIVLPVRGSDADWVELEAPDDGDESLGGEDEVVPSAVATPCPVATATTSQADTASPL